MKLSLDVVEEKLEFSDSSFDLKRFTGRAAERWELGANVSDEIRNILGVMEKIKDDVKNGQITTANHEWVIKLAKYIRQSDLPLRFHEQAPAAYYQTMGILSEQFFRFGDLGNAISCVESAIDKLNGRSVLEAISAYVSSNKQKPKLLDFDSETAKEQIRFALAYLQTMIPRNRDYSDRLKFLEDCRNFVNLLRENSSQEWFGTRALIEGHLGRCYRNRLEYDRAVQSFGRSINFYEKRLQSPKTALRGDQDQERSSVQNKMALTLILGYAWMDIQRGQFSKGLYNSLAPARTLLAGMNDELAINYLRLLEVGSERGLSLPLYLPKNKRHVISIFNPENVLNDASKMLADFNNLKIPKFILRAQYEYVMCLIYCKQWAEAHNMIDAILKDLEKKAEDRFWHIKISLLRPRLLSLQKHYGEDQVSLNEVVEYLSEIEKLKIDSFKQTHMDFYQVRGEAYLSWHDFKSAALDFEKVMELNRNKPFKTQVEPFNPRLEAKAVLRLAEIDLVSGYAYKAQEKLKYWYEILSKKVDDVYLHNLAEISAVELSSRKRQEFFIRIESEGDLKYHRQEARLREFLIDQSRLKAEMRGEGIKSICNYLGVPRSTYYNWLGDEELKYSK